MTLYISSYHLTLLIRWPTDKINFENVMLQLKFWKIWMETKRSWTILTPRMVSSTCGNHVCWGKRGKIYKGFCKKWFFKVSKFVFFLKPFQSIWSNDWKKNIFFQKYFCQKYFLKNIFFWKNIFDKKYFRKKNIFFGIVGPNALKWL